MNNDKANPGALIIDGHGRADLGVVRALGEHGVPVYLLTDDRASPVAASRFVTRVFPFPPRQASDDARMRALTEIGKGFRHKPVFFSTGDSSLVFFSRHRRRLEDYFHHHIGDPDLVEALYDKMRFADLAMERGLEVPFSVAPRSLADVQAALDRLTFPVMVKAAEKRCWAEHPEICRLTRGNPKGVRIETAEELVGFYREVSRYDRRMVMQDYIEGRDEEIWSLHTFVDRDGEPIAVFTGQKLRTYPIHCGIGCFQVSRHEPAVVEAGVRALQALGYTGHAVVNVKRVPGGNEFKILEINCRYSSWNYLHTRAGVNMPYAAYRSSFGQKQAPLPRQREGVRWIDASNDLRAFRDYRRLGEWRFVDWIRSYPGDNCYAFFAWNDPGPALAPIVPALVRAIGYPFRRLRRRALAKPMIGGQDA
jgi:D-aspartate ligase